MKQIIINIERNRDAEPFFEWFKNLLSSQNPLGTQYNFNNEELIINIGVVQSYQIPELEQIARNLYYPIRTATIPVPSELVGVISEQLTELTEAGLFTRSNVGRAESQLESATRRRRPNE